MEKSIEILKKNGWYENRKIDISYILTYLKNNKYNIYDSQKSFLENFGKLKISFKDCNENGHFIEINPVDTGLPLWAKTKYEKYLQKEFIIIGEIVCENNFLLMDKNLNIYCAYENEIAFVGKNFYDFLEDYYFCKAFEWKIIENFFID